MITRLRCVDKSTTLLRECQAPRMVRRYGLMANGQGRTMKLTGLMPALVTPFAPDGTVDFVAFGRHMAALRAACVSGWVPCGLSGEYNLIRDDEREEVLRTCQGFCQARRETGRRNQRAVHCRGDRQCPARQGYGIPRRSAGRAVLNQADAGRDHPAFQRSSRCGRHECRPLLLPRQGWRGNRI